MITSVTLTNYPKFSNKLSLDLLAEDIALSLRQAQIFGSSVLGSKSTNLGQTKIFGAYGVHFEAPTGTQSDYTYILFADIANIRRYNLQSLAPLDTSLPCGTPGTPTANNECLQKFIVSGRNKIKSLCANFIAEKIPIDQRISQCRQVNFLDVVFVRPNLDALFTAEDAGGPLLNLSNIGIVLESSGGDYHKTVVVWKTGQISVE